MRPNGTARVQTDHPLSPGGNTLALLDACVLLPPRLADLLFDLFIVGLYSPRWTWTIEQEFITNFAAVVAITRKKKGQLSKATPPEQLHIAKAQARLDCFRLAVGPEYQVLLYEQSSFVGMVPPAVHTKDRHLASAAIVLKTFASEESPLDRVLLVTSNIKHLAVKEMKTIGIEVLTPGEFINRLCSVAPARVRLALSKTMNDLTAPPYTRSDLATMLQRCGADAAARVLLATH